MKKTIIVLTGILAMAVTQSALASGDGHNMKGHMQDSMKNPCAMTDHQNMQDNMKNPCAMKDHQHMKGEMKGMKDLNKQGQMKKDAFVVKKEIDGFSVSFHIMEAPKDVQHGGTHHFMVKIEKDGKALTDLVTNSKATHPNGKSESKMLMKMGDWYMASYDLGHEGKHQMMVLFKTADGAKHFGGVFYPEDK